MPLPRRAIGLTGKDPGVVVHCLTKRAATHGVWLEPQVELEMYASQKESSGAVPFLGLCVRHQCFFFQKRRLAGSAGVRVGWWCSYHAGSSTRVFRRSSSLPSILRSFNLQPLVQWGSRKILRLFHTASLSSKNITHHL